LQAKEEDNVELRLKLNVSRRVKKLKKLRRRLRIWGVAEVLCIALAAWPLVMRVFLENLPFFAEGGTLFGAGWAQVFAMVGAGFLGALLCSQQHKRDKDKFDRIRAGTIVLMEASSPVCECKWMPCDCKDELIRRMKDKYDINLSY
jgi:hypothetical protein